MQRSLGTVVEWWVNSGRARDDQASNLYPWPSRPLWLFSSILKPHKNSSVKTRRRSNRYRELHPKRSRSLLSRHTSESPRTSKCSLFSGNKVSSTRQREVTASDLIRSLLVSTLFGRALPGPLQIFVMLLNVCNAPSESMSLSASFFHPARAHAE